MKRPILIVGSVPRITIPIARSLHGHGVPVEVVSFSAQESPPWSRAVSDFIRLPAAVPRTADERTDPDYAANRSALLETLIGLIHKRGYDMLIPAHDSGLAFISQHDAVLRQLLYLSCPPPAVVQRVLDKSLTLEIARQAGVRAPSTYHVSDPRELEALTGQLHFPVVVKPCHKSDEMGFKVRYFQTCDLLHQALAGDHLGQRVILQEFAQGEGVGVEVLMHRGDPLAIFQHRRLKEVPATGGVAAVAIAESPEAMLVDQALALLRALEWEGVAMVEFRYDRVRQQTSLMEVNGRYWGTVALPLQSGVDFPWYEWQIAHGEKPAVPLNYSAGARWLWSAGYMSRWHDLARNSVAKAFQHPAGLKEIAWSELVPSKADFGGRDALWDPEDPMPAIGELLQTVKTLAVSDLKGVMRRFSRATARRK